MRARSAIVVLIGALALAGSAGASGGRLTMREAHRAVRAYAAVDHPRSTSITGCQRYGARRIGCSVTEHGIVTSWTDNGQPIVGDLSYTVNVLRSGRFVHGSSELFTGSVTVRA